MWRFFQYRYHPAGETCKGTRPLKPLFLTYISDKEDPTIYIKNRVKTIKNVAFLT